MCRSGYGGGQGKGVEWGRRMHHGGWGRGPGRPHCRGSRLGIDLEAEVEELEAYRREMEGELRRVSRELDKKGEAR